MRSYHYPYQSLLAVAAGAICGGGVRGTCTVERLSNYSLFFLLL